MPINRRMDKEDLVHTYNGILFIHKKLQNNAICSNMDRPWERAGGTVVKNTPANAGDTRNVGSVPGFGRSLRVGSNNPLQYSCPGNSRYRGTLGLQPMRLSMHTHTHTQGWDLRLSYWMKKVRKRRKNAIYHLYLES